MIDLITPMLQRVDRKIMLENAHRLLSKKYGKRALWAMVSDICSVGSTSACQICNDLGWNPHQPSNQKLP